MGGIAETSTWEIFRDTLIEQAEQGVDYFTIHARRAAWPYPPNRGARHRHRLARRFIMAKWCLAHHRKLPHTHFADICEI